MHLRVSDEAEMMGLDLDQFFDEQIGEADWGMFSNVTNELPAHAVDGLVSSGGSSSVERDVARPDTKEA